MLCTLKFAGIYSAWHSFSQLVYGVLFYIRYLPVKLVWTLFFLMHFSSHRLNTRLRSWLPWVMEEFKEHFYLSAYFISLAAGKRIFFLRITVEYRKISGKSLFNAHVSRSVLVLVHSWSSEPSTIKQNLQFDGVKESP